MQSLIIVDHFRSQKFMRRHLMECLTKAGVLKKVNQSKWAAPTFLIPKKDATVWFISDFHELNKRIKQKPYLIPKIQDLLLKLEGFQYAMTLDLNMGYYDIELSPSSKCLCTIVMPFGKCAYQHLPMGLCNSPDIFQECMYEIFFRFRICTCVHWWSTSDVMFNIWRTSSKTWISLFMT
jgi:hypothetical protein